MVLGVFLAPWWQRISWLMIQAGCKGKCNPGKSCGMWAGSSIHSGRDLPPTQKADHSESSRVEEPGKGADQTANTQFRVPACKQDSTSSSYHPTSNDKVPNMAKFKKKVCLPAPVSASHSSSKRQKVKPSAAKTSLQGVCIWWSTTMDCFGDMRPWQILDVQKTWHDVHPPHSKLLHMSLFPLAAEVSDPKFLTLQPSQLQRLRRQSRTGPNALSTKTPQVHLKSAESQGGKCATSGLMLVPNRSKISTYQNM